MCKIVLLYSRYAWFEHLLFICNTLKRHWIHANTSAGCQHKCIYSMSAQHLPNVAKRHQSNVQMGKCSGVADQMPTKPDIGPMSACPSASGRTAVGLIGILRLIGIWSAFGRQIDIGIIHWLAAWPMSALIGI